MPASEDAPRIAVVTHGQASSPFWAIVRTGVEAAERQMNVQVDYEAPDVYSLARMIELIDEAVATKPDGLVVSFPEPGLGPAIRRAVKAGIPVITINSGSDAFRSLGVLAHVGQPEDRAGLAAGKRLVRAGARRVLCVNQQVGNVGLDARCAGLARAVRSAGGSARVLGIDDQSPDTPRVIARAVTAGSIDGILATNATGGLLAVDALAQDPPPRPRRGRRLRPRPRHPARRRGGQAAVRDRPAALPPGLPAGGHARQPRPLRPPPGAGRRARHGRELRHPRQRRQGAPAQRTLDPLKHAACGMPHATLQCPGWDSNPHALAGSAF